MVMTWNSLNRTGEGSGDQDADLPGSRWAEIGMDSAGGWSWTVMCYEDGDAVVLESGYGPTEDDVKRQVALVIAS